VDEDPHREHNREQQQREQHRPPPAGHRDPERRDPQHQSWLVIPLRAAATSTTRAHIGLRKVDSTSSIRRPAQRRKQGELLPVTHNAYVPHLQAERALSRPWEPRRLPTRVRKTTDDVTPEDDDRRRHPRGRRSTTSPRTTTDDSPHARRPPTSSPRTSTTTDDDRRTAHVTSDDQQNRSRHPRVTPKNKPQYTPLASRAAQQVDDDHVPHNVARRAGIQTGRV
jgi:hypothetical protein